MDENALICSTDFEKENELFRTLMIATVLLLLGASALAQDPIVKHFAKDGLSFDYPAAWQLSDKSSQQMQLLELAVGDVVVRVRSPREWLKTPEKQAHAKNFSRINTWMILWASLSRPACTRSVQP